MDEMQDNDHVAITGAPVTKMPALHDMKKRLLSSYRSNNPGILDKLEKTSAGFNVDQLMNLIMEDLLNSTEDLQATTLFLEGEGNLRDASAITIRRADLLRVIADIAGKKKELIQRAGEVDLNSPAFMMFQKICFDSLVSAMEELKISPEMVGMLINKWQEQMKDWDKRLKKQLKELED